MKELAELTITSDAPGAKLFMLGNEAIARGAIEAGVQVVAAYPGTPSSEITNTLVSVAKETGMYAEWSVNEKVAMEVAMAASVSGLRAMAAMKHVGVNVAHDPLTTAGYMGARGGLVLVSADDPGQWSSQNEQDNRYIARQCYIPVLEPSSVQEAKDMLVDAFRLSEEFKHIFMLRSVTRLSHARSDVVLGAINKEKREGEFVKDLHSLVCLPAYSRGSRRRMIERFAKIKGAVNDLPYNQLKLNKGAKLGIIACGISYGYTLEAIRYMGLEDKVSLLKIGTPYPLPEEMVRQLLSSVSEVLVVEELEPFVEDQVKIVAEDAGIIIKIHGKDVIPIAGELSTRPVAEAISGLTGAQPPVNFAELDRIREETEPLLPFRPPTLCAGCPHRASLHAINVACRRWKREYGTECVLVSDIGCYALGVFEPLNADDIAVCMGGGFGIATGLAQVIKAPVVGHLGDSTFFHSGIPPMINAVFHQANVTLVILDNSTTGMTGFQPHPGAPAGDEPKIMPEDVARACGVKFVEVVDPFDLTKTVDALERAIRYKGPAVVITRRMCSILEQREKRRQGVAIVPYHVDPEKCDGCGVCINLLGCPAIIKDDDRVTIDSSQCPGCGLCAQVCPHKAIISGVKDGKD